MFMRMKKRMGQSASEYIILTTIVVAAIFVGGIYFKRGIQGRWRDAVDGLGDQYDPELMNGVVTFTTTGNTTTYTEAVPDVVDDVPGYWTLRLDSANITQSAVGSVSLIP
jgi:hypothetical protein